MIHAGTLTPRFDAGWPRRCSISCPSWTWTCTASASTPVRRSPGARSSPHLLADHAPRVSWHGVLTREALPRPIDGAAVALMLNRRERSGGQDSMKLYDYAARGAAIVTTRFAAGLEHDGPPT